MGGVRTPEEPLAGGMAGVAGLGGAGHRALRARDGRGCARVGVGGAARADPEQPEGLARVARGLAGRALPVCFFAYNPARYERFLAGVRAEAEADRGGVYLASGCCDRGCGGVSARVAQADGALGGGGFLDAFYAEYVCPGGDFDAAAGALEAIREHQVAGRVGFVGASTHSASVARALLDSERHAPHLDLLMLRYNMSHDVHEANGTLEAAQARGVAVVAFTSTRWNGLCDTSKPGSPTAADCVSWALSGADAVLHSPRNERELRAVWEGTRAMAPAEVERWRAYGRAWAAEARDGFEDDAA